MKSSKCAIPGSFTAIAGRSLTAKSPARALRRTRPPRTDRAPKMERAMATAVSASQTCRNFINGRWVESSATRASERRNPANLDEIIGFAPLSTREETREAVAAARAAFPSWRDTPAPVRSRVIAKAALLMEQQKDEIARLMSREEGKALKDALGEVQKSINILEFMAGEGRRLGGETIPSEMPKNFAYTLKQPLGVVAAIAPWNL